jgi:hypothetical protein
MVPMSDLGMLPSFIVVTGSGFMMVGGMSVVLRRVFVMLCCLAVVFRSHVLCH